MSSLFYFPWTGNKRGEVKYFIDYIKAAKPKRIIEPFCGSCAVSLHCSIKEGLECDYIVNDTDPELISFLEHVKTYGCKELFQYCEDNRYVTKEEFKKIINQYKTNPTLYNYLYYRKIYNLRPGIHPPKTKKISTSPAKYLKTDKFFKQANITHEDYNDCINKYKDDPDALVFLDPPYLDSCNSDYSEYSKGTTQDLIPDNTVIFIDILNYLKNSKCKIILIMNGNALTRYLFNPWIRGEYTKTYQLHKRKTKHLLITNFT